MNYQVPRPPGIDNDGGGENNTNNNRRGLSQQAHTNSSGSKSYQNESVLGGRESKRGNSSRLKCLRPGCGKTFSKSTHLLRHEAIHRGTNVRKCPLCEKSFSRPDSLRRHRHLVHGEEDSALASTPADGDDVNEQKLQLQHQHQHQHQQQRHLPEGGLEYASSDFASRRRRVSDYADGYSHHGPSPSSISESPRAWYSTQTSSMRIAPESPSFASASGSNGTGRASMDLYENQHHYPPQQQSHSIASPISTLIHSNSPPQGLHLVAEAAVAAAAANPSNAPPTKYAGNAGNAHKYSRSSSSQASQSHQGPYHSHHADTDTMLPRSHFHDSRFPAPPSLPAPHASSAALANEGNAPPRPMQQYPHNSAPNMSLSSSSPSTVPTQSHQDQHHHQHEQRANNEYHSQGQHLPNHHSSNSSHLDAWAQQEQRQTPIGSSSLEQSSNPSVSVPTSTMIIPPSIAKFDADFGLDDLNTGIGFVNGADWSLLNNVFLEANLLDLPGDALGSSFLDHRASVTTVGIDGSRTPTEPKHIDTEETAAAVSKLRSLLTSAVEGNDLPQTSKRLANTMFRQFLAHFLPSMPAFHESLFGRDGTSPGLLLTAISMGSLYVGSTEALAQGIMMWRLASSAVWSACLFTGQTSTPRNLAELIRMCVIGHIFAIMGADRPIYQTARLVFPLAISAGHKLGLFSRKKTSSSNNCPVELAGCQRVETAIQESVLQQYWRVWVREQEDCRVAIAVHIYDSQLSSFQGTPPLSQHFVLDVLEPDCDGLFAIDSARQWWSASRLWETDQRSLCSVSDYYEWLFSIGTDSTKREGSGADRAKGMAHGRPKSVMTMYALLEGINSSVCLNRGRRQPGSPSTSELMVALGRWSELLLLMYSAEDGGSKRDTCSSARIESMCLWTRWHSVHLSLLVPSFEELFDYFERQAIGDPSHPVASFAHSESHRRALVHAGAVWHLFNTAKRGLLVLPHVLHALYQATAVFLLAADFHVPIDGRASSYELLEPFYAGTTMVGEDARANYVQRGGLPFLNGLIVERDNRNIKELLRTLDFVGGGDEGNRHVVFGKLRKIFFGSSNHSPPSVQQRQAFSNQQQQQSYQQHQNTHSHAIPPSQQALSQPQRH